MAFTNICQEHEWTLSVNTLPDASCELPSIDQRETKHTAVPFRLPRREHSTKHFCPMTSNPPEIWWHFIDGLHLVRQVKIEGWWERRKGWEGKGNDSSGCSVTLEEIRRLSSPLMMVEIVFQLGGEMPELSSLFCVALRASCVRFRLPVFLSGSSPLSLRHKRQHSVGWWTPRLNPTLLRHSKSNLPRGFLKDSHDRTCGWVPLRN